MQIVSAFSKKVKDFIRGRVQRWGSASLKQRLWDREFSEGRWGFIENTPGDPLYHYVEKYCKDGSILDLGCGSGNTGCELNVNAYGDYTGVDISEVALDKARERSADAHRAGKNRYFQSDILDYSPDKSYDVILFRESIYYIPGGRIKGMLDGYSSYLKPGGVFIIRWHENTTGQKIPNVLGTGYKVLEEKLLSPSGPIIIIFSRK
jgi:2-polyprenyl-6-hydroxyphenyl methylase/3-demethylubiquinone-9 3-methyltransferase